MTDKPDFGITMQHIKAEPRKLKAGWDFEGFLSMQVKHLPWYKRLWNRCKSLFRRKQSWQEMKAQLDPGLREIFDADDERLVKLIHEKATRLDE